MLTLTTLGTFAGATTVTAALYHLVLRGLTPGVRRWALWGAAVAVVAADRLWTGPVSVSRIGLWILNGVLVAASATGSLQWVGQAPTTEGTPRA